MKPGKNAWRITWFLVSLIFLVNTSCNKEDKPSGSIQRAPLQVEGYIVKSQRFENTFISTANLLSFEEVELRAPVSGTVLNIYFNEGEFVKEGQVLVRLDDRSLTAQVKTLQVQLDAAKRDLSRKNELLKIEGVSEEEVERSKATVDEISARIDELNVNISLANVKAPFEGRVGLRNFSRGSYLNQGQTITQLVQTKKLKVDFNIGSRYLKDVKIGTIVKVISASDSLDARVYAISPFINSTSRTAQVRALIENNNKGFIPGDFAEVELGLNIENEALVVPSDVIMAELNAQTLYLYKNGRAIREEVLLGGRTESVVQILAGIEEGDTVLTTGLIQVKDNMAVNLVSVKD